jgi:hypothetical protein
LNTEKPNCAGEVVRVVSAQHTTAAANLRGGKRKQKRAGHLFLSLLVLSFPLGPEDSTKSNSVPAAGHETESWRDLNLFLQLSANTSQATAASPQLLLQLFSFLFLLGDSPA